MTRLVGCIQVPVHTSEPMIIEWAAIDSALRGPQDLVKWSQHLQTNASKCGSVRIRHCLDSVFGNLMQAVSSVPYIQYDHR